MIPSRLLKWNIVMYISLYVLISRRTCLASRPEVITGRHGVVATDDGRCSRIGRDVLREGGHAVDASIAAALCLGVVGAASSGIGGGSFMLVQSASGEAQAFDMRETAPLLASKNMYAGNATLKAAGALSIAVPGELAGLHKAWKRYGRLPWKRLVMPAETLARRGFKITPYLYMQMVKTREGIMSNKGLRAVYTSNGELLKPGQICYNGELAETLRTIAKHGVRPFYNGLIGMNLVRDVKKAGGIMRMADLQRYQVKMREPVSFEVLGLKIFSMPPPSAGGVSLALMLNVIAEYGARFDNSETLAVHREIEALKHAAALKMNLGDPDYVNVKKVVADMLSVKFAKALKKTIYDNMTFGPGHYGSKWNQIEEHGTSHLSVVDSERNAVALTTSVNSYFGAQILSPSTGILLNNEMDDFSMPSNISKDVLPPAPTNFVSPGKRPLSSMTPTIVLKDGKLKAVLGASGGARIIAGMTEVFVNHFVKRMDPLSSVMAPRLYHQLIPNVVEYENWTTVSGDHFEVTTSTRAALWKKGHKLQSLADGTICQMVVQEAAGTAGMGKLVAVSDPRKGGLPAGY